MAVVKTRTIIIYDNMQYNNGMLLNNGNVYKKVVLILISNKSFSSTHCHRMGNKKVLALWQILHGVWACALVVCEFFVYLVRLVWCSQTLYRTATLGTVRGSGSARLGSGLVHVLVWPLPTKCSSTWRWQLRF